MAAYLFLLRRENRRHLNRERIFRDRKNPLDFMRDDEIVRKYRLDRRSILELCDLVNADLERPPCAVTRCLLHYK